MRLLPALALLLTACNAQAKNPPAPPPKPSSPAADGAFEKRLPEAELEARKKKLPPEVANITQHEGTELPFKNAYWDNHAPGIYVDVVSGEPLFSSKEKFESGTGWPSFYSPLEKGNVATHED